MALICDTSGVLALYDASNADHAATSAVVEADGGDLLIPVVLLAEIDYLLHARLGAEAARDFVWALTLEEFTLVPLEQADVSVVGHFEIIPTNARQRAKTSSKSKTTATPSPHLRTGP